MKNAARPANWRYRAAARTLAVALALAAGGTTGLAATAPAHAAPEAVDGAQTAGDSMFPHVGNGGYDALHYDVDLAWESTGVVGSRMTGAFSSATTTMRARTTGAPLRSFSLDFEGLQVESVTVDGVAATYERVQDPGAIRFKLIITPATPVDGEFTTIVAYSGVPQTHVDADNSWEGWSATTDGAIFLGQPIGAMTAFPHNNTPGDKATYTFTVDAPTQITSATGTGPAGVASNGELHSRTPSSDGTRTTWRWVQQEQMASSLALISIGKYDVLESQVTLASGRVLPEWSFVDSSLSAANKTTINERRAVLAATIDRFERLYGPYPGNSVGIVVDTVPTGVNYALETQDRPFFPSAGSVASNTLLHELVHQWYGDAVSPHTWTDIWINEGMGTWGPSWHNSVLAAATPNPAAVETTYFNSWNNTAPSSANWRTPPGNQTNPGNLYGFQTYTRGAQFWEALRTVVRDEAFQEILQAWISRNNGGSPQGERLKELAEEISGHDLDAFWQDWILEADKPAWPAKYDVSLTASDPTYLGRSTTVTYTLRAANVGKVALGDGVVEVDVHDITDDAALDPLPGGLTRDADTLTWTVPQTPAGQAATITFTASAADGSPSMGATASPASLGGGCASCSPLAPVPDSVIVGDPVVGRPLTVTPATWPAGTTLTRQWSVDAVPVADATEATFTPRPVDVGRTVTVAVTGTKPGHDPFTRVSAATAVVAAGTLDSTPSPTLGGPAQVGVPVSAVAGAWDEGVALAYQWQVASANVHTGPSYTPVAADAGKTLTVTVTGTKPGYESVVHSSAPALVVPGTLTDTPVPALDGAAQVGLPVGPLTGTWDEGVDLTFAWQVAGVEVATSRSYTPTAADAGKNLSVTVTGTKPGYDVAARSSAVVTVDQGALGRTPQPTIDGSPVFGSTLSVGAGTWDEGVTISYQWLRGGALIAGADRATYVVGLADLGAALSIRVTGTKPGYAAVAQISSATAAAVPATLASKKPRMKGTLKVGKTLKALPGLRAPDAKFRYRWTVAGKTVGSKAKLKVRKAFRGKPIKVAVTVTRAGYVSVKTVSRAKRIRR
ncbi:M1 family aminopeptidase [Nocardioides houyundeii]|uniref:M1 family aminopeptidase n=1 Tax=Nocardioides houyundeii TaxID=2045452 RepID=UPI000C785A3A|nr:M1 family aminopeptidase [Nocardioides houyundeii]